MSLMGQFSPSRLPQRVTAKGREPSSTRGTTAAPRGMVDRAPPPPEAVQTDRADADQTASAAIGTGQSSPGVGSRFGIDVSRTPSWGLEIGSPNLPKVTPVKHSSSVIIS
jgi:hypothetical protein